MFLDTRLKTQDSRAETNKLMFLSMVYCLWSIVKGVFS